MSKSQRLLFPKITGPSVVIIEVEKTTGIVLTLEGKWFTGKGETYRIFSSLADAERFAVEVSKVRPSSEFNLYNSSQKFLKSISSEGTY